MNYGSSKSEILSIGVRFCQGILPRTVTYHPGLSVTYLPGSYHSDRGDDEIGGEAARDERGVESLIEGGEASAVLYREAEEVEIGEALGSGHCRKADEVTKAKIVG